MAPRDQTHATPGTMSIDTDKLRAEAKQVRDQTHKITSFVANASKTTRSITSVGDFEPAIRAPAKNFLRAVQKNLGAAVDESRSLSKTLDRSATIITDGVTLLETSQDEASDRVWDVPEPR